MKRALVCVGSPLQALSAVEALNYFNIQKYDFKVIDDGARLSQIESFLRNENITYQVIPFHFSPQKSIKQIINSFNPFKGNYDFLLMGDYRLTGHRLEYLPLVKSGGSVIFLDDGNYIIDLVQNRLSQKCIVKVRNMISKFVCRIRRISDNNLFTIYANHLKSNSYNIVENKFTHFSTTCLGVNDDIYIIGTNPTGDSGYCTYLGIDYNDYKRILKNILCEQKKDSGSGRVIYLPHGRDLSEDTKNICFDSDAEYVRSSMCAELLMASLDNMPKKIVGFGSSALYTLHSICPHSDIVNIQIMGGDKENMKTYLKISELYQKVGITNKYLNVR